MQGLASIRMKTEPTNEVCPIHHIKMVTYGKLKPFCIKCTQEQTEKEKKNQVDRFKIDSVQGILQSRSLVDDKADFDNTFKNFQASKGTKEANVGNLAFKAAKEYISFPDKAITTFMYGTPGQGKSHLAMAMLNEINSKANPPQSCLFIDVNHLFTNIKRSFNDPMCWWSEYNAIDLLTKVDVLVLDDLGSESSMKLDASEASDYKQGIWKAIFGRQKRLIVTTNLTMDQLRSVYNPKLVSRLLAGSRGHQFDFSGIRDKRY